MKTTAIATLTEAFNKPLAALGRVVLSWPSVPVEIVRAAGLHPFVMRGSAAPTPTADVHLEAGVFPSRLRQLAEAALSGDLSLAARIVVPRTSDPDYKCFLYLREFVRLDMAPVLPPISLFDLLQSEGPDVRSYNAARIQALFAVSLDAVRHEITRTNLARAAARRLAAFRRGVPRVTGSEALPLFGAFWNLDPDAYAALAHAAAEELEGRPVLSGPRILLAGAPVDGIALHSAIESRGAVVVAEIGPWGSGVAGDDVSSSDDPMGALADKYGADAIGARTPLIRMRKAITSLIDGVDAVVVSLPPEDTVFGWDYPWLRDLLEKRGIPHARLESDSCGTVLSADQERLDAFMSALARTEVRRG